MGLEPRSSQVKSKLGGANPRLARERRGVGERTERRGLQSWVRAHVWSPRSRSRERRGPTHRERSTWRQLRGAITVKAGPSQAKPSPSQFNSSLNQVSQAQVKSSRVQSSRAKSSQVEPSRAESRRKSRVKSSQMERTCEGASLEPAGEQPEVGGTELRVEKHGSRDARHKVGNSLAESSGVRLLVLVGRVLVAAGEVACQPTIGWGPGLVSMRVAWGPGLVGSITAWGPSSCRIALSCL